MCRNLDKMLMILVKEDQNVSESNSLPFADEFVVTINYDKSILLWTNTTKKKGLRGSVPHIQGRRSPCECGQQRLA